MATVVNKAPTCRLLKARKRYWKTTVSLLTEKTLKIQVRPSTGVMTQMALTTDLRMWRMK